MSLFFFFFNDTATTEIYTLSLHDALPISLEADGRRRLRAHRGAAERPRDVAGEDLDAVPELDEPAQAVEEALGSLARLDRQIRPAGVADEERVAGEDEPGLLAAGAVDHREAAVLGAVARCVDRPQDDRADLDLRPVVERLLGGGGGVFPRVLLVEQPQHEPADRAQEDERLFAVHQDPAEVLVADRRQPPQSRRVLVERVERAAGKDVGEAEERRAEEGND